MVNTGLSKAGFRKLLLAAGLVVLLFGIFWRQGSSNLSKQENDLLSLHGSTMGTFWNLNLAAGEAGDLQADIQAVLDRLDHDIFSTWSNTSDITRFNELELPGQMNVSAEMLEVTRLARHFYDITAGAFDPSVGPLVNLWGFGPEFKAEDIPAQADITAALSRLGFDEISIADNPPRLGKERDITLDYSSIAKGYAVDQVAALLEQKGFQNFLLEVGGEILVKGERAAGQPWRIGIEYPEVGARKVFEAINNRGERLAIAGSGDYRNFFELDGRRYSHEIDPSTGWPVLHDAGAELVSVTVIHDNAASADALATALMVMGAEQGMQLASELQLPIYFIIRAGESYRALYSDEFMPYLGEAESAQQSAQTSQTLQLQGQALKQE